jgi:hypothetical protein
LVGRTRVRALVLVVSTIRHHATASGSDGSLTEGSVYRSSHAAIVAVRDGKLASVAIQSPINCKTGTVGSERTFFTLHNPVVTPHWSTGNTNCVGRSKLVVTYPVPYYFT